MANSPAVSIPSWPIPFDPQTELDWGEPVASRRLLREHLDQAHDGASRRIPLVQRHVARLRTLLPPAPARILDAACGPGLYAVRLARLGHDVVGVDVGAAVLRHARTLAASAGPYPPGAGTRFLRADLREELPPPVAAEPFDAVLLVYFILEGFPRRQQVAVLRRLGATLRPGGRLIAELRVRPEQPPGRLSHWERVDRSLLSDRPHLLLTDTTWDPRRRIYILREVAVLPGGGVTSRQTTGALTDLEGARSLVRRAGLRLVAIHDGWSRHRATGLSESLLVVAERPRR